MRRFCRQLLHLAVSPLPAWMLLVAGCGAIAATLLLPAYDRVKAVHVERQTIQTQALRTQHALSGYEQLLLDVRTQDPATLERLAYHYLRLKQPNAMIVTDEAVADRSDEPFDALAASVDATPVAMLDPVTNGRQASPIVAWVSERVADVQPAEASAPAPPVTLPQRVVRLLTGPMRWAVVTLAAICLLLGLMPPRQHEASSESADEATDGEDFAEELA